MGDFMAVLGSMSIQASIIIVVVLMLRIIFKKLHVEKKYMMFLWVVPFFCLIFPWKISVPNGFWQMAPSEISYENTGDDRGLEQDLNIGFAQNLQDKDTSKELSADEDNSIELVEQGDLADHENTTKKSKSPNVRFKISHVLGVVWATGVLVLLIWNIINYRRLKGKLICSIKINTNVYHTDEIFTPIVVGVFKPSVYLPLNLPKEYEKYVLAHEKTHIRRFDIIYKMVIYTITCIHWFNPIVWYAFYLFNKDMEMCCDEETVRILGEEEKEAYAKALLGVAGQNSLKNRIVFVAPVAFEEGNVKSRIKNIMQYKKTVFALVVCVILICVIITAIFMTKEKPVDEITNKPIETSQPETDEPTETKQPGTEEPAETKQPATEEPAGDEIHEDNDNLQFSDLEGLEFWFCSGAGAWRTIVKINADGTFTGEYSDSDMGNSNRDLYPKGTRYECHFSGKFSAMTKTGDYEYSMKCEYINIEEAAGKEEITDGVRIIYSEPYGFDNADEFILYLPGKAKNELAEGFLSWSNGKASNGNLECYGLYNVGGRQGFIVW